MFRLFGWLVGLMIYLPLLVLSPLSYFAYKGYKFSYEKVGDHINSIGNTFICGVEDTLGLKIPYHDLNISDVNPFYERLIALIVILLSVIFFIVGVYGILHGFDYIVAHQHDIANWFSLQFGR